MMQLHLDELSRNVSDAPMPCLLLDGPDGTRPSSSSAPKHHSDLSVCPPAPAEGKPVRERSGSISARTGSQTTVFENYDADHRAAARLAKLIRSNPETITSIRNARLAHVGQPL